MDTSRIINVFETVEDLELNAAQEIIGVATAAVRERGTCFIALSGGETPRGVYRRLGADPLKNSIDWNHTHLFFGDERAVPPADPQSNFGMVERELISHIDIPPDNVHRIRGEATSDAAAKEYEGELQRVFERRGVRFDLVLLGLGEDGHTASLFPGTDIIEEEQALVRGVFVPRLNSWRISLTFRSINSAREVLFLVSGKHKAPIVGRVLTAPAPMKELPATLVQPVEGMLRWMIDKEAAAGLKPPGDS